MLSDILPTGYEIGVLNGAVKQGDVVAVVGVGPVGLAAVMTASSQGASKVIAVDGNGTVRDGDELISLIATDLSARGELGGGVAVTVMSNYGFHSAMDAAGVEVAFAMPGASWDVRNLAFQAGTAIAFGLAPDAALRALTLAPAGIAGVADRLGSLEVGKEATIVVSTGDLLDPLTQKVTHLLIQGREVNLDNRHRRLYEKYRRRLTPAP